WGRLAARDWFEQLCHTRRPIAVTSALVEAATRAFLGAHPNATEAELVALFRSDVLPRTGRLFARSPDQRSPLVATGFLLRALATDEVNGVAAMRSESTESWSTEERERFKALLELTPISAPATAPGEPPAPTVDLQAI